MARMKLGMLFVAVALCGLCSGRVRSQDRKPAKSATIGFFMGSPITEEEAKKAAAQLLQRLELQRLQAGANYARAVNQALEAGLQRVIEEKVLNAESSSRGVTTQALLEKELAGKVKEPTMEDLKAHYPPDKVPAPEALEKIFPGMRAYLKQENYNKAKSEYVAQLEKKYRVTETLEPLRVKVDTEGNPAIGPRTAPVTVVDFTDFQCSSCGGFDQAMMKLVKKYDGRVRLVYRSFALQQPFSEAAAEAALCAGEQGRFWEMHDLLQQGHPEPQTFNMHALSLNLDLDKFGACLSSSRYAEKVNKDLYAGAALGVAGTPSLFVNGRPVFAPRTIDDVDKVIADEPHRSPQVPAAAATSTDSPGQFASRLMGTRK